MSKYSDKTFEKILDDMCRRVKECSTMEGSFIYTALAPFAMELALLYLQLEQDEKNGFADTADYEHLKYKNRDGVKYCNISDTLEQCPFYDNNKPRPYYYVEFVETL